MRRQRALRKRLIIVFSEVDAQAGTERRRLWVDKQGRLRSNMISCQARKKSPMGTFFASTGSNMRRAKKERR